MLKAVVCQAGVCLSVLSMLATAQDVVSGEYSLEDLQGAWWTDCEAPAAEFLVEGNMYSGDFEGSYTVTLSDDVLTFGDGLTDGHSTDVTHAPLQFRIIELSDENLRLHPLPGNPFVEDWRLRSCD